MRQWPRLSQVGMLGAKRGSARVEAGRERWPVLAELASEAVHRPHARGVAQRCLQAGMLRDESRDPCPRRKREQSFDEASADEGAGTVALQPRPAKRVKLRYERGYLRRVKEFRNVANSRVTRYVSSCHGSYPSCGHGPGSVSFTGPLFVRFAGVILAGHRTAPSPALGQSRRCPSRGRILAPPCDQKPVGGQIVLFCHS